MPSDARPCPCLSGETYAECCGVFHSGAALAPTAERLMRSRYSAYAVGDAAYLSRTWHPSTRPTDLDLDDSPRRWFRLDILGRTRGSLTDTTGTVEFAAHYRDAVGAGVQHENSSFVRESGAWLYVAAV